MVKQKKIVSMVIIMAMMCSLLQNIEFARADNQQKRKYEGKGYEVVFQIDNSWDGRYQASISIKNTGEQKIENWALYFDKIDAISHIWNSVQAKCQDEKCIFKNAGWNQDINIGETVCFGFTVEGSFDTFPEICELECTETIADSARYSVEYTVLNQWEGQFIGNVTITNTSSQCIEDWHLKWDFTGEITNIWNARIMNHQGNSYDIGNESYNQNIQSGQSVTFGFCAKYQDKIIEPQNIVLKEYHSGKKDIQDEGNQEAGEEFKEDSDELPDDDNEDEISVSAENAKQYVGIEFAAGNTYESVIDNVKFVNYAEEWMDVTWESSDKDVISDTGKVKRQNRNMTVVITANISIDGELLKEKFTLIVIAENEINVKEIEDLNVEQLKDMNEGDDCLDIKINDFGYLERMSGRYSDIPVNSYESAMYSLYNIRSAIGMKDPFVELVPYSARVSDVGYIFKFQQVYEGIKTFDNTISIVANKEGVVTYFSSSYFPITSSVDTRVRLTYEEAVEQVQKEYGKIALIEDTKECCLINYHGHVDLAWSVSGDILDQEKDCAYGYHFLVGCSDGEIKYHQQTDSYAKSSSSSLPVYVKDMKGDMRKINIKRKTKKTQNILQGSKTKTTYYLNDMDRKITIYDGKGKYRDLWSQHLLGAAGYRSIKKSYATGWRQEEVSAMANMEDIYDYYKNTYNRYSYNDGANATKGAKVKVIYNSKLPDNAEWRYKRKEILIGKGTGETKENGFGFEEESLAKAADILCHEFTHGVIAKETDLEKIDFGILGAINEAYADLAACFYDRNWTISEDMKKGKVPMRDISNPERVDCPSKVGGKHYVDVKKCLEEEQDIPDRGGVHTNCTILSHAVYLMAKNGIPERYLKKIWYESLCMGYKTNANFYTVRINFEVACRNLLISEEHVKIMRKVFNQVNVTKESSDYDYSDYYAGIDRASYSAAYFCDDIAIQGKVVEADDNLIDADNEELEEVQISVYNAENGTQIEEVMTDEEGEYEADVSVCTKYQLDFQCEGYLPETLYLSDVNTLLQTEYICDTVEMVAEKDQGEGGASGKIKDAATGKGVSSISLTLRKGINNTSTKAVASVRSSSDGSYGFDNLDAGMYCVEMVDEAHGQYISSYFNIKILGNRVIKGQDGIISSKLSASQMRAVLTWGDMPEDLDSHMSIRLSNDIGGHVYYRATVLKDSKRQLVCALDLDDIDSYGPETITVYSGETGDFQYYVHQYSEEGRLAESGAVVKVYLQGASHPAYVFRVPRTVGRRWDVFQYNSATQRIIVN